MSADSVHSEVAVQSAVKKEDSGIPDVQAISFQVCMPNRYKLNKAYRKLKAKSKSECKGTGEEDSSEFLAQLNEAGRNAEAENEDNATEQKKYRGTLLHYGQVIQLRHMYTGKHLHISTNKMAKEEATEMRVELSEHNAKEALYRIMPKYKVKSEGDLVQSEDQVVFESMKSMGQFLHSSKVIHGPKTVYAGSYELNLSIHGTAFLISRRYKPDPSHENFLNNGSLVRLFHKEFEAYLCAEGLFDYKVVEDVHLRVREIDYSKPKTAFPTSSAINYWQLELQNQRMSGNVIRWDQPFLLKHVLTRRYLSLDANSSQMRLTSHRNDPANVFRAHPVTVDQSDYVTQGMFCRIEHIISGSWLHAVNKQITRNSDKENTGSFQLKWTTARMIKLGVSHEMQFADAFTLQAVQDEDLSNCYYALGMVPFLQKLVRDMNHKLKLAAKDSHDIVKALVELKNFMIIDGEPDKNRQKLLRNLMLIELLVTILKSRPPHIGINIIRVYEQIYQVIQTYLLGNSRKNELYLAKYLDFFLNQLQMQGSVGLKATHMVTELIRDNRKIVDRVTRQNIELFVNMLEKHRDHHYLELLEVLCVCDGVAMPDNQKAIAEIWLLQKKCVYHTVLGKEIGMEPRVVYVSWDNARSWLPLHDFTQKNSTEQEKRRSFLQKQLELFGKLCRGRNAFCIRVITEELKYLTWEEAFICVSDEQLPDAVRAKYCDLIIDLFVDVEGNNSLLDNITLTFLYDNIGENKDRQVSGGKTKALQGNWTGSGLAPLSQLESIMEQLQAWIARFLDSNKSMVASREGHNMLLSEVLSLLKYLVKFGYYSNTESIDRLREPLLGFLDGRNDLPYPMKYTVANPDFDEFQEVSRFKKNYNNHVIVEAKCQAVEVLDLLMNFQFNMRLESFVGEFKHLHQQVNSPKYQLAASPITTHPLMALLKEDFNLEGEQRVIVSAKTVLDHLFQDLQRFSSLKDILMDLARYVNYSEMVLKSMSLLARYYSMYENLFNRAVQAQILVTDMSCQVYNDLQKVVPVLRKLSSSRQDSTQTNKTLEILDKLIRFCCYDMEVEIHPMNQTIIYNYGILSDVFEILAQEIDLQLSDKYGGFQMVVRKCCSLLTVLAKENSLVQERLFDRLDLLLSVKGAEEELAGALTEVFTGNKSNCLKVHFKQIQRMVAIAAKHGQDAPQLFSLLKAVVKVEEMDLPLKRNQDYVMKYITQYRASFALVLDCGNDKRMSILSSSGSRDCVFLTSLVDLMASCSEGENKFIESLCQSLLGKEEILDVLAANNIGKVVKRAYIRFLHWVYLNTGGEQAEVMQLSQDRRLWEFIETLYSDFEVCAKFAKQSKVTTQQILRRRYDQSSPSQIQSTHDLVHFLIDAVVPFVEIYFKSEYPKVKALLPNSNRIIDRITQIYLHFCEALLPQVTQPSIKQQLLSCATALVTASALPLAMLDRLQDRYSNRPSDQMKSNAQKRYEQYYSGELSLNEQFNQFANNFSLVFGGLNTVQAQIGFPSQQEYTEVGEDEDLPLGPEFQAYIQCFINPGETQPEEKYQPASVLLEQLQVSDRSQHKGERQRLAQKQLDIKCMQVLRGIIHNEVVKLPADWEINPKLCHRQLAKIEEIQNALDGYGAMPKLVVHLNSGVSDDTIKEALALLVKLLFGGNRKVQKSLAEYFHSTREERFFVTIKSRMQIAALAVKEKRGLVAQHQAIVVQAVEQIKMIKSALERGDITEQDVSTEMGSTIMKAQKSFQKVHGDKSLLAPGSRISMATSRVKFSKTGPPQGSRASIHKHESKIDRSLDKSVTKRLDRLMALAEDGHVTALDLEQLDVKALEERLFTMSMKQEEDISHGESYMTLMLRVMGHMCDGQFSDLQDYMREQLDNFLSADLVSETTKFLGFVYGNINGHNVELVTELLQALVEFVSGSYKNQVVVFDNKICDYLDFMLQSAHYVGCSEIETLEVKKTIGNLIRALTEENLPDDIALDVPAIVMENLDPNSIAGIVKDSHKKYQSRKLSAEARKLALNVAFQYYFILCRMKELREDKHKIKNVMSVPEDKSMWKYLDKNSMSVEIAKGDQIHRVQFPVRYKTSLRSEVKTRFNYEVDRTASERINDFMEWVADLKRDVFYTRRILGSDIARFFVKMWYPANILMMFLSFVALVLMSVIYIAPEDNSVWVPERRFNFPTVGFLVLGILHVIVTACVLVSYFIINKPKLPVWMRRGWRTVKRLVRRDNSSIEELTEGAGHLDVHFFGMKTVWYLLLMSMSILGLIGQGYLLTVHLLHISEFNQLLKRALQAVSRNGVSLIMIFVFGLMIIFIFAQVNFAFYRNLFDSETGLYCTTMYECFVTVFHRGLVVSLYEGIPPIEGESFTFYLHKAFTDLVFFMVITVVGLDIVFGIVVDTFAELRDSKWQADQEMNATCFICGMDSHLFEKKPGGFEHHVKQEHCQWAYMFFFMHLEETRPNDYTALELYVSHRIAEENFCFFPLDRALSLEHETDEKEERINYLERQVTFLVNKIKEQEAEKERTIEQLRLVQWEKKHKKPVETKGASSAPAPPRPSQVEKRVMISEAEMYEVYSPRQPQQSSPKTPSRPGTSMSSHSPTRGSGIVGKKESSRPGTSKVQKGPTSPSRPGTSKGPVSRPGTASRGRPRPT